jgi:hypothetical protein
VLSNRQFYQACHAIDVDAIELCPGGTANRTGTVHHGICSVNQATEALAVLKISFDPTHINVSRSFMG